MYHRHELFSEALQCIFWAGLDALQEQGLLLADSRAFGEWFTEEFEGAPDGGGDETLAVAVDPHDEWPAARRTVGGSGA